MIAYRFSCQCGHRCESDLPQITCACGRVLGWSGMVQRPDHGADRLTRGQTGFKIAPDLSAQQQAYIETPEVQAKLKSGEYAPIQKGSDEWNHGH